MSPAWQKSCRWLLIARRRVGQKRLGCGAGAACWPVLGRARVASEEGQRWAMGEHGAQMGDLVVGRRFIALSITTSITLSGDHESRKRP